MLEADIERRIVDVDARYCTWLVNAERYVQAGLNGQEFFCKTQYMMNPSKEKKEPGKRCSNSYIFRAAAQMLVGAGVTDA
jgi:hypothetical protein